jgi:hypothetical protein
MNKPTPTLVFIGPRLIGETQFYHGDELPPDLLSQEQIDKLLDLRWLAEVPQRRPLYRIFAPFSGAQEREPLDAELTPFALPT